MRFAQNANTSPGSDSRIGKRYAYFNPRAPIRDLRECADLMAITYNQRNTLNGLHSSKSAQRCLRGGTTRRHHDRN